MRYLIYLMGAFLFGVTLNTSNVNAHEVPIEINNIDTRKGGIIYVIACDKKDFFEVDSDKLCEVTLSLTPNAGKIAAVLPLGDAKYAIYGYHMDDETIKKIAKKNSVPVEPPKPGSKAPPKKGNLPVTRNDLDSVGMISKKEISFWSKGSFSRVSFDIPKDIPRRKPISLSVDYR